MVVCESRVATGTHRDLITFGIIPMNQFRSPAPPFGLHRVMFFPRITHSALPIIDLKNYLTYCFSKKKSFVD